MTELMGNQKVYKKGNSLLEIRGNNKSSHKVLQRIRSVYKGVQGLIENDPLSKALDDLLIEPNSTEREPQFILRDHVVDEIDRLKDDELNRYFRYRYMYDVYPINKILSEYPPLVQIEPTSICNYRCIFCYQIDPRLTNKKNSHMGIMDLQLFKSLVDELEGKVEAISLASRGEPTINKMLPEMLNYLEGKFLAIKVNTNASLLDETISRAILDADIQTLVFSADAAVEPLYSQLRVGGSLDKITQNIERFHKLKNKHYSDSRLITRVSGVYYQDEQKIEDMEAYWKDLVDQVAFVDYNPWENVYDADVNGIIKPCSDLWRRLFVWWDGRVNPCDVDYLSTLSDERFPDRSITEIWRGETFESLRKNHLKSKRQGLKPCAGCALV